MRVHVSHLQAGAHEGEPHFAVPFAAGSPLQSLAQFAHPAGRGHVNWPACFASRGLPYEAYRRVGRCAAGFDVEALFRRIDEPSLAALPQEVRFRVPGCGEGADATDVPVTPGPQGVLLARRLADGYLQLHLGARLPEPSPDGFEVITTRAQVEELHAQCAGEAAAAVAAQILAAWEDDRSFVIVRH